MPLPLSDLNILNLHVFFMKLRQPGEMEEKVLHDAVVQQVLENKITVVIINASACASCHAKGACLASDMKEKEIEIVRFSGQYHVGQQVNIVGHSSQGLKAAFYGYLLPFLMVLATLLVSITYTKSEGLAGLLALAALFPYYGTLYFFRDQLKRTFEFEISAINH